MVSLEHQGASSGLRDGHVGAVGAFHLDVFVDEVPVVPDFQEPGIFDFLSLESKRGARNLMSKACHSPGGLQAFIREGCPRSTGR